MHMRIEPKGPQAARLRQRKFELLRRFAIPADLLPGSLSLTHRRCGQPTCHCAQDKKGTPSGFSPSWRAARNGWSASRWNGWRRFSAGWRRGASLKRRWPRSSPPTLNCWRSGGSSRAGERAHPARPVEVCDPTFAPAHLPAGSRRRTPPPADSGPTFLWSILVGCILRQSAFRAIEAWVSSSARRALRVSRAFSDDALRYFTERLSAAPPAALASVLQRAKRNKAFEACRFVGLALDGTTGGRRRKATCRLCRPYRNAAREIVGYRHHLVLAVVVGGSLTLPWMSNPTGRVTVNTRPGSACSAACVPAWERVSSITWWWTENSPPPLFCTPRATPTGRSSPA